MDYTETNIRLYGLFAQDNSIVQKGLPFDVLHKARELGKDEEIISFQKRDVEELVAHMSSPGMNVTKKFVCLKTNRHEDELFGHHVQLVASTCIHTQDRVVMLELERDTMVDNYVKGSLTYPQGHCEWDFKFDPFNQREGVFNLGFITHTIKENAFREVHEEIRVNGSNFQQVEIMNAISEAIFHQGNNGKIYPIYLNKPGTTIRHFCALVDVDLTRSSITNEDLELLVSNEPEKHKVRIIGFEDLLKLERVDTLCPWVATSFARIPFFGETFLNGYLSRGNCT